MRTPTYYASLLKKYLQKFGAKVDEEVDDGHKHIDLSIDAGKLDVEVDGAHHLMNPHQIETDYTRAKYSREDGYETIHVHNMDLKDERDAESIARAIVEVAEKREKDFDIMAGIK